MEDISIIESENLQGIVVFYNPGMITKTGHEKTLEEYHKNKLPLFPIIENILMPLLVEKKGRQYADWIPVSLFIGQIINGEYLPVLRLIEKPSIADISMLHQIDSPEEQQIISRYIDSYIRQYMNLPVSEDKNEEPEYDYYMLLFHNFSHMLEACLSASFQSCGQREIWKHKDTYYVIFDGNLNTVNQIAHVLMEYNGHEPVSDISQEHIMEHGTCITKDILKLQKAFS